MNEWKLYKLVEAYVAFLQKALMLMLRWILKMG